MAEATEMEQVPEETGSFTVNIGDEQQVFMAKDMTDEQKSIYQDLALVTQRKNNIIANANADLRILNSAEKDFKTQLIDLLGVEIPELEEAPPEEEAEDAESKGAAES